MTAVGKLPGAFAGSQSQIVECRLMIIAEHRKCFVPHSFDNYITTSSLTFKFQCLQ